MIEVTVKEYLKDKTFYERKVWERWKKDKDFSEALKHVP